MAHSATGLRQLTAFPVRLNPCTRLLPGPSSDTADATRSCTTCREASALHYQHGMFVYRLLQLAEPPLANTHCLRCSSEYSGGAWLIRQMLLYWVHRPASHSL